MKEKINKEYDRRQRTDGSMMSRLKDEDKERNKRIYNGKVSVHEMRKRISGDEDESETKMRRGNEENVKCGEEWEER